MAFTAEIDAYRDVFRSQLPSPLLHHALHGCGGSHGVYVNAAAFQRPAQSRILDNGLVFGAKVFVAVARRYGLSQEYITPYTPEQNGMIERFFKTVKEECIWLHRFRDRDHAFTAIAAWLERYDRERPHSALGYLTPKEYREKLAA